MRHCSLIERIRQNRPRLARLAESCFLLDGTSSIATGLFCRVLTTGIVDPEREASLDEVLAALERPK